MIGSGKIRQRIAAKNRRFSRIDEQPQNHKLTCLEDRKRSSIDRRQNEGTHAIAFLMNIRDSHVSKSGPRWCLFLISESRISLGGFWARLLREYCLKGRLPTHAKRRNA